MSSAQDPFYIVKEEIQESVFRNYYTEIDALFGWSTIVLVGIDAWRKWILDSGYSATAESFLLDRKVDELDKTISVSARDPSWYGIDEPELEKRRRWTSTARAQVGNVKKAVVAGRDMNTSSASGMRKELMRLPNTRQTDKHNNYSEDNDDFIQSESDSKMLLIKRQDEELDELSASVERIGGVGLTIHEELIAQEKIIDELGNDMESTSNRLDFVQKKVATVMKKAGAKGQIMMILFLVVLVCSCVPYLMHTVLYIFVHQLGSVRRTVQRREALP